MADGLLGKCKTCTKADVKARYAASLPERHAYEKARYQTSARKEYARAASKLHAQRNPEKQKARTAVGNAIRDGRLRRLPCEVCGIEKTQAHHEDYSKPLDVRWLCFRCHRAEHGQKAD